MDRILCSMTPIAVTLRAAREAAGLSQQQLADAADVRQATISDLESGRTQGIRFDVLDRLCEALGVAPGDLLERNLKRGKAR